MKLFLIVFHCFFGLTALAANPADSCSNLLSRASRVVLIDMEPTPTSVPALPKTVTQATKTATAVSTTTSVILGVTQVSQGSRVLSLQNMVACDDNAAPDSGPLAWTDSPTQLSIGNTTQQYDLGAVVGNWAVLTGATACWTALAAKLGTQTTRYPGGLTMPVMFFMTPTTSSAISLLRAGTYTEQVIGGLSITAQAIGMGLVAVFLHPAHFGAQWTDGKWADKNEAGYVQHYGMLFKDYRSGAHAFITVEFLMSLATGILQSYQGAEKKCRDLLTASAVTSTAYALTTLFLRPHVHQHERIFYGVIASLQAVAMTTQASASWFASEETQQKIRTVTESILTATQWALLAKSIYDLGRYAKSIYDYLHAAPSMPKTTNPILPLTETPGPTDSSDTVSIELNAVVLSPAASDSSSDFPELMPTDLVSNAFGIEEEFYQDPYLGHMSTHIDADDLL